MTQIINVDNNEQNSDWIQTVRRTNTAQAIQRTYLQIGEKPPEGVQIYRGPRGGQYYIEGGLSNPTQNQAEDTNISFMVDTRLKETVRKKISDEWLDLFKDFAEHMPKWIVEDAKISVTTDLFGGQSTLVKGGIRHGLYDPKTDEVQLNPILLNLTDEESAIVKKEEYNDEIKGHPFQIIVAHEFGHRTMSKLLEKDKADGTNYIKSLLKDYIKTPGTVTKYGKHNGQERFAEAFLYYFQNPRILRGRDPLSYHFIKMNVFGGKEFNEPILKSKEEELPNGSAWIEDPDVALRVIEKTDRNQEIKKSKEALKRAQEKQNPFVTWEPDKGLIHKELDSQPSEDPLKTPEYGAGTSVVGDMSMDKSEDIDFDKTRKAIKRILHEDKKGR